jgi:hypothetical protein
MFYKFALVCAIKKVQENQEVLELNRTHQPMICAEDINLVGGTISVVKTNMLFDTPIKKLVCK